MSTGTAPSLSRANPADLTLVRKLAHGLTRYLGLTVTSIFFLALLIALHLRNIPWGSSPSDFLGRYAAISAQSIAYAVLLSGIGMPRSTVLPFKNRYQHSLPRLIVLILLTALCCYLFPPLAACLFSVIAISMLEIYERGISFRWLGQPLLPGLYLFIGLITVFGYNAVVVTDRSADYSHVLARLDSWLLFGHSVSELGHRFAATAPPAVTNLLMVSYFALFAQIGATLVLLSFAIGRSEAMRFVSSIMLAYLFTMTIWALFPTFDPHFSCATHAQAGFPRMLMDGQMALREQLRSRQHHLPVPLSTEYYVSFPCMHLAQPLIALWFLRRWRRIVWFLIPIDILIAAATVLFEWHYAVDLFGGVIVAAAAIALMERFGKPRNCRSEPSAASARQNPATTAGAH
ncbi:MAG TPA: phosphatase PAP2 family protein [Acidobacteriaceae bacterium]|nr:phosphatase PAP2 family protein [Acidobacteriaceae bacterium]